METALKRSPSAPILSEEAVAILTDLCFGKQDLMEKNTEAVAVFGVSNPYKLHLIREHLDEVVRLTNAHSVFIAGGKKNDAGPCESVQILAEVRPHLPGTVSFYCDKWSQNTKENALALLKLGLGQFHKVAFIAAWGHCGRCRLTLAKYHPKATFLQRGYIWILPGQPGTINPDFWYKVPSYVNLIWGEFLRIESYGKRGDIAYPPEIEAKVNRVRELTAGH